VSRQRLGFRLNFAVMAIAVVVTLVDAITKAWARHDLSSHAVHVFGFIWFRLQFNSGVSFSLNRSGPFIVTLLFVVIALCVVGVGLVANNGLPTVGFGLLIGGGVANVIDRLSASPHRVTDFIAVSSFPIFNGADAAITIGFVVLATSVLRGDKLLSR
jgi:signal peptidase II